MNIFKEFIQVTDKECIWIQEQKNNWFYNIVYINIVQFLYIILIKLCLMKYYYSEKSSFFEADLKPST